MQLLEKFGITQFLNNGVNHPNANMNDALQSAPNAEQLDLLNHYENFVPPASFNQGAGSTFNPTSFSPFSPDPSFLPEGIKRDNVSPSQLQMYPSSAKGFAPWYNSTQQDEKVAPNSSGKVSPPSSQTSRPASARAFGSFLGDAQNASSFAASRASSRQEAPIARPDMPRRSSQTLQSQEQFVNNQHREHDPIQDLNGTLASLNLDTSQGSWKSGHEGANLTSP